MIELKEAGATENTYEELLRDSEKLRVIIDLALNNKLTQEIALVVCGYSLTKTPAEEKLDDVKALLQKESPYVSTDKILEVIQ